MKSTEAKWRYRGIIGVTLGDNNSALRWDKDRLSRLSMALCDEVYDAVWHFLWRCVTRSITLGDAVYDVVWRGLWRSVTRSTCMTLHDAVCDAVSMTLLERSVTMCVTRYTCMTLYASPTIVRLRFLINKRVLRVSLSVPLRPATLAAALSDDVIDRTNPIP